MHSLMRLDRIVDRQNKRYNENYVCSLKRRWMKLVLCLNIHLENLLDAFHKKSGFSRSEISLLECERFTDMREMLIVAKWNVFCASAVIWMDFIGSGGFTAVTVKAMVF